MLASLASGAASAATAPRNGIGTGWNVHLAYRADGPATSRFFNASTSFGAGPSGSANPVTDGLSTSATPYYSSYAQFQPDINSGDGHRRPVRAQAVMSGCPAVAAARLRLSPR